MKYDHIFQTFLMHGLIRINPKGKMKKDWWVGLFK